MSVFCVCLCGFPPYLSNTDVHTVASLLKLYLRELPEPLVPFSRYQEFLICGKKIPSDREQVISSSSILLNYNIFNRIRSYGLYLRYIFALFKTNKIKKPLTLHL